MDLVSTEIIAFVVLCLVYNYAVRPVFRQAKVTSAIILEIIHY